MRKAIGLIETIGLAAAIDAADAAVKSANVELIGTEYTKGDGMVVVKIEGDVGAVNAGVEAARQSASKVGRIFSYKVIPRPSSDLELSFPEEEATQVEELVEVEEILEVEDDTEEAEPEDTSAIEVSDETAEEEKMPEVEAALEETEDHSIEVTSSVETDDSEVSDDTVVTCNLCNDPKCSRKKGDLHVMCLHYLD